MSGERRWETYGYVQQPIPETDPSGAVHGSQQANPLTEKVEGRKKDSLIEALGVINFNVDQPNKWQTFFCRGLEF